MKKIAWITPSAYMDTDYYIVPLLCKYYHIDWFILYKDNVPYEKELNKLYGMDNLAINLYEQASRQRSLKTALSDFKLFWHIKKKKYDIVYAGMFGFPYFHVLSALILNRNKVVIAAHNVNTPKGAVNYWPAKVYAKYVLSVFKNFQTFSESQRKLLLRMYPHKKVLMAPFLLKDYGTPTNKKSKLITFLSFGNIREYKRIDVLINAAQNSFEKTKKLFKVIIAGNCDNWGKYQSLIRYPQLFDLRIGRVENDDIPNLFGESHYFVTPYQDIAQSGSVVVGINYECPIIASNLEAFREYIKDGETGYLIKPADVNALTTVMVDILETNNVNYEKMRNRVRKIKETDFNTQTIIDKYVEFFDSL